jgi:mono/diheme cytochrome c family protein
MSTLKKTGIFFILFLLISQFFGPEKNDGNIASVAAFISETNPSEEVKNIFQTSCYDCHSSKTVYPWYNKITPVNYWLAHHVKEGKQHLNFSKWNEYSLKKKAHKMEELYEEVEEGEMPLKSYSWTHSEANLTAEQINAVVIWSKKVQADYLQQMNKK